MIFKIGQKADLPRFLPRLTKKSGKLWFTNYSGVEVESYPSKSTFFWKPYFGPWGCCTPKFLHTLENDQVLLLHSLRKTWSPRGTVPRETVSPLQFFSKKVQNWL